MKKEIEKIPNYSSFWALCNGSLSIYFKDGRGNIYINGPWEVKINPKELLFVELIPFPKDFTEQDLEYYEGR